MAGRGVINAVGGYELPWANYTLAAQDYTAGYNFMPHVNYGGYPTQAPTQTISFHSFLPDGHNGPFVFRWAGLGTLDIDISSPATKFTIHEGSVSPSTVSSGVTMSGTDQRVRLSFNSFPSDRYLQLKFPASGTYGSGSTQMGSLIMCRDDREAAVLAGDVINPDFAAVWKDLNPSFGRMMDLCAANGSTIGLGALVHVADMTPADGIGVFGWRADAWVGTISGVNTKTCSLAARHTGKSSYVDGDVIQGVVASSSTAVSTLNDGRGAKQIIWRDGIAYTTTGPGGGNVYTFTYNAILDKFIWNDHGTGIPGAYATANLVSMANATNQNMWINFPFLANDTYVNTTIAYIRDHLNRWLKLRVEYSNEIWNSGFGFTDTSLGNVLATALGFTTGLYESWYGFRFRQMLEIASNVWTSGPNARSLSDLHRCSGVRTVGDVVFINNHRFLGVELGAYGYNTAPNRPLDYIDEFAPAMYTTGAQTRSFDDYFTTDPANINGVLTAIDNYMTGDPVLKEAAFNWMYDDLTIGTRTDSSFVYNPTAVKGFISNFTTLAATHGKSVACYEGGLEPSPISVGMCTSLGISTTYAGVNGSMDLFYKAFKNSRQCYRYTMKFLKDVEALGAAPAEFTLSVAAGGAFSQWDLLPGDIYSTPFQTFKAFRDFNNDRVTIRVT